MSRVCNQKVEALLDELEQEEVAEEELELEALEELEEYDFSSIPIVQGTARASPSISVSNPMAPADLSAPAPIKTLVVY